MRARSVVTAVLLAVPIGPAALGGPPLVCHPYVTSDAPAPPPAAWLDANGKLLPAFADELVRALDLEDETLVRMHWVQQVFLGDAERDEVARFLDALARRAEEASKLAEADPGNKALRRLAAARRLDDAIARETRRYTGGGGEGEPAGQSLRKAVGALEHDAAAWLCLARAVTPLMRTGSHAEHARAFVKAYDLAHAMPAGPARERLDKELAYELEHLEAYLLDRDLEERERKPSPEARLELLREYAAERRLAREPK
jgi:hypothetical protein